MFDDGGRATRRGIGFALGHWFARVVGRQRPPQQVLFIPSWIETLTYYKQGSGDTVSERLEAYSVRVPVFPLIPNVAVPSIRSTASPEPASGAASLGTEEIDRLLHANTPARMFSFSDLSKEFLFPATPTFPPPPTVPDEPEIVDLPTDAPTLKLPYYQTEASTTSGLREWFYKRLNKIVDAAHTEAWGRYAMAQLDMERERDARVQINARRNRAYQLARTKWKGVAEMYELFARDKTAEFAKARALYDTAIAKYMRELHSLKRGLDSKDRATVEEYFGLVHDHVRMPAAFPKSTQLRYDSESGILVVEQELPDFDNVTITKTVALKSGNVSRPVGVRERTKWIGIAVESTALRVAVQTVRSDPADVVAAVAVNLLIRHLDKRTGHPKVTYVASLYGTKSQLMAIDLAGVDPNACFASLKGKYVPGHDGYESVEPIIRFDFSDDRFVAPREVLAGIREGENLAAMDWDDFEHLIRELFEREFAGKGGRVEITRASRDRGVDAVVFDPDPIRGGKFVIQAKRYTNTVDVSAVRDLYGTVVNEGAMKGILVSTASFGPDAYTFARDKPITLMPGSELLWLLERHGFKFRIDLDEARRLLFG